LLLVWTGLYRRSSNIVQLNGFYARQVKQAADSSKGKIVGPVAVGHGNIIYVPNGDSIDLPMPVLAMCRTDPDTCIISTGMLLSASSSSSAAR